MRIREKYYREAFIAGLALKALDGALELLLAAALLFSPALLPIISVLAANELIEDPDDLLAHAAQHYLVPFVTDHGLFLLLYLASHGLIKLLIVGLLLKGRLWAYPLAILIFGAFVAYQAYTYLLAPSPWLIILSGFDLIIIALTWHEWRRLMRPSLHGEL